MSALHRFAQVPYIGGQSNRGHGRVGYHATIVCSETGEQHDLIKISSTGLPKLSKVAEQAKQAYDQHLQAQYDAFLEKKESEIRSLLGAPACGSLF